MTFSLVGWWVPANHAVYSVHRWDDIHCCPGGPSSQFTKTEPQHSQFTINSAAQTARKMNPWAPLPPPSGCMNTEEVLKCILQYKIFFGEIASYSMLRYWDVVKKHFSFTNFFYQLKKLRLGGPWKVSIYKKSQRIPLSKKMIILAQFIRKITNKNFLTLVPRFKIKTETF